MQRNEAVKNQDKDRRPVIEKSYLQLITLVVKLQNVEGVTEK